MSWQAQSQGDVMTKARYVNELAQGGRVDGTYMLRAKELRVARTGDAYLSLVLADRTGSISAVLFRPSRLAVEIPVSSVVRVRGIVTSFRGARRVTVEDLVPAESWNPEDLLASASRLPEEVADEFGALVRLVTNSRLRQLLRTIFGDKAFFTAFSRCPATRSSHRACLGGLIEHTTSVARLCADLSRRHDGIDHDLLVTAALVHDVGIVDALSFDTGISETDRGRLVGHAVLGAQRVREAARRIKLTDEVSVLLEHIIMSHHESDSAPGGRPLTLEALALQHVDRLDTQIAGFSDILQGAVLAEESWTDENNSFHRSLHVRPGVGPRGSTADGAHLLAGVSA